MTTGYVTPIMRVKDLLAILAQCDPELPVTTHTHNHTCLAGKDGAGPLRVGKLASYAGEFIVIGNFHKADLNYPNEYVTEVIGGPPL